VPQILLNNLVYRKVVCALSEQSYKLGHATAIYLHPRYHEYVEKLTSRLPSNLSCVYLTNSGSEATELGIQLARLYTGHNEIISLRNCYHGGTAVAAATTGMSTYKYSLVPPPGHIHVSIIPRYYELLDSSVNLNYDT
jgi:alanine-glyoxylate transaminase/(R)-3-amino-2-methylpropionate-pyruvate transaminase